MYSKEKNRVKKSVDINQAVALRITEIKEKDKISLSSLVNELMDKTVCLHPDVKKRLLHVLETEVNHIRHDISNCGKEDYFWLDRHNRELQKFEELIELLEL